MKYFLVALFVLLGGTAHAGNPSNIKHMVGEIAVQHGVPVSLAQAIVRHESKYNCAAHNRRSGASGIMQTLPRTARGVGVSGNLHDCRNGLVAGMRYLRQALTQARGNLEHAATLYNRGTSTRAVSSDYSRLIMKSLHQ